jgi:hypothetical protein
MFSEDQVLSVLTREVQLTVQDPFNKANSNDENGGFINDKQKTLNHLLDIILLWRPSSNLENEITAGMTVNAVSVLACNFGLHFARNAGQTADSIFSSETCLLKVVRWFRYCLASNTSLQKSLLGHMGEPCLQRLLFMFGLTTGAKTSLVQELNMIFLVLLSHVQHVQNDVLGTTANKVAELLSCDVYHEVVTSGLVDVLLPLCPSPLTDETIKNMDGKLVPNILTGI